jgi:D-alanyl-D-alanine carboxypeptidase
MKKKYAIIFIITFITINLTIIYTSYGEQLQINSSSAILIDSSTGKVLFEKNIDEKMYPASITKIMTAIIAIETGNMDDIVTASYEAVHSIPYNSSNAGICVDEKLSLKDLMYCLLIVSANESANVIAEHIAGSIDEFVKMMNTKAYELGATSTNFVNPHGLHNENHYTTAHDMALIAQYAMKLPVFREIVKIDYIELPPTEKYDEVRYLSNTNHLINRHRSSGYTNNLYAPATGIKTGYTSQTGYTLVASAQKDGMEFISVVLCGQNDTGQNYSYADTINMFNYGFDNYKIQKIVSPNDIIEETKIPFAKDATPIILAAQGPLNALLPNEFDNSLIEKAITIIPSIEAPINRGDIIGFVSYSFEGIPLGGVNLLASRTVERDPIKAFFYKIIVFLSSIWVIVPLYILFYFVIFVVTCRVTMSIIKKKKKKRKDPMFLITNNSLYTKRRK